MKYLIWYIEGRCQGEKEGDWLDIGKSLVDNQVFPVTFKFLFSIEIKRVWQLNGRHGSLGPYPQLVASFLGSEFSSWDGAGPGFLFCNKSSPGNKVYVWHSLILYNRANFKTFQFVQGQERLIF